MATSLQTTLPSKENFFIVVKISFNFCLKHSNYNNLALVKLMTWHLTVGKPLPEPMMTHFTDFTSPGLSDLNDCKCSSWLATKRSGYIFRNITLNSFNNYIHILPGEWTYASTPPHIIFIFDSVELMVCNSLHVLRYSLCDHAKLSGLRWQMMF